MFALEPTGKRTGQKKPDHELSSWAISALSQFPPVSDVQLHLPRKSWTCRRYLWEIWIPGVKSTFWEICIITDQRILAPWCLKGPRLPRTYETSQKIQKGFQRAHLRKCALVKESGTMTLSCEMTWSIFRRQSQALKDSDEFGLAASSSKIKSVRQEKRSSGLQAEAARWGLAQCLEWDRDLFNGLSYMAEERMIPDDALAHCAKSALCLSSEMAQDFGPHGGCCSISGGRWLGLAEEQTWVPADYWPM